MKRQLNTSTISKNLYRYMSDRSLSVEELSKLSEVPISSIKKYLAGKSIPITINAFKISQALNICIEDLIF